MNVLGIDNILLAVGNLDQARAFYGQALDCPRSSPSLTPASSATASAVKSPDCSCVSIPISLRHHPEARPAPGWKCPTPAPPLASSKTAVSRPCTPHGKSAPVG